MDIAKLIQSKIDCEIEIKDSNDPRSYRLDSNKLVRSGFIPKSNIDNAIEELIIAYKNGSLKDSAESHTVKWMKSKKIKWE